MQWDHQIKTILETLKPVIITPVIIQQLIPLIDLTSLNDTDTETSVATFLQKAYTPQGNVAAVCIYPAFVRMAANEFVQTPIKVATVANFPKGTTALDEVLIEINDAIADGVQEIDVVFPYQRLLTGDTAYAQRFIADCKTACGEAVLLKVILETSQLQTPERIAEASNIALTAGADFIKTSTGKVGEGASLTAAVVMLSVIKALTPQLKRVLGFKVSGGVREWQQAAEYVALAEQVMGANWVSKATFRIGASKLIDNI
ncbi:MAG TPA: deoxyribose-phosphate aldolase [Gammaproteobacteria bacterium]|jgi:deoxyribose-phosphate aldolase|nr:deoxyribose-phosphate aldolase [Gammaproteobacteria bacterium]